MQPDKFGLKLIGMTGPVHGGGQHIAATDIDFIFKAEGDGLSGTGFFQVTVHSDNPQDTTRLPGGRYHDLVAGMDGS